MAQELGISSYFETNVEAGTNIQESLGSLAEQIMIQRCKDDGVSSIGGLHLRKQTQTRTRNKKRGCCPQG